MDKYKTIMDLQQAMDNEEITAKELSMYYLQRIANYDKSGPIINSVIEINPEALHIAEALDMERKRIGKRGPLHGIPILIKDNIDTADKMHTSAGSLALANHYATKDSFVVKKLREAGAVILGKTNLTEWANFMTEGMPNGYSSRGGQVLNPYGPGVFDVGGSSSGSSAAVASDFATGAIGTETSGSILSPASSNSLVGIKPTVGLISRTGIIPISNSQDTAGPITTNVTDAAILLGALTGVDNEDSATNLSIGTSLTDYTMYLNKQRLSDVRIGIDKSYFAELSADEQLVVNQAISDLQAHGATIIDTITVGEEPADFNVLFHEFKSGVNAYLAGASDIEVRSLRDVIAYNKLHPAQALRYGQVLLEESDQKSGTLTEPEYIFARLEDIKKCQAEGIDFVMKQHQLDALLFANNYGAGIAAKAGYPSITVPAGYTEAGLPVGITFTGTAFTEPILIELAYSYEQATNHREEPNFKQ
ncbi:amidase family protein [Aquibacillus salsiterrae]|uniref:Amidase family protein n=1 Tax=Aquibacillus salsiterrae TaxID=2950439 RepID=A0A9X3WGB4_9BACI|nr:amidase family protein [Aquibacillus salsiterrae]MDC3416924.1 amidase family protein [Aquibacillus salsiterrae]